MQQLNSFFNKFKHLAVPHKVVREKCARLCSQCIKKDISIEDVKIPEKCPVLGILLVFSLNKRTNNTPSIDRIDSSKGYIKGNVIVVSWRANMLKNNGTWQEHQQIADYYKGIIK